MEFVWVHSLVAFCLLLDVTCLGYCQVLDLRFLYSGFLSGFAFGSHGFSYGWLIIMVVMAAFGSLMDTGMDDFDVDQVLG